jgi:hypothetical protein
MTSRNAAMQLQLPAGDPAPSTTQTLSQTQAPLDAQEPHIANSSVAGKMSRNAAKAMQISRQAHAADLNTTQASPALQASADSGQSRSG